jgi:hypothetical protein
MRKVCRQIGWRIHRGFFVVGGLAMLLALFTSPAHAQGNYEIQVYGADTVSDQPPGARDAGAD